MRQGNGLRGEAFATIGDEEYHFVLDNHALIGIEKTLGISALDVIHTMQQQFLAGQSPMLMHASAVAYGCLYRQHPDIDEDWVIEHMFDPGMKDGLMAAFEGANLPDLPADDNGGAEGNAPKPKRARGTGKKSSARGAKPASARKASGGKRRAR